MELYVICDDIFVRRVINKAEHNWNHFSSKMLVIHTLMAQTKLIQDRIEHFEHDYYNVRVVQLLGRTLILFIDVVPGHRIACWTYVFDRIFVHSECALYCKCALRGNGSISKVRSVDSRFYLPSALYNLSSTDIHIAFGRGMLDIATACSLT